MVDAHQMQDRGVQIMHAHAILDSFDAQFVGGSKRHAAFDTATSQPHAESGSMMIATLVALSGWRSSELPTPHDQRVVEQSA